MVYLKEFFEKVDLEKISKQQKSMQNYPVGKELKFSILSVPVCAYMIDS